MIEQQRDGGITLTTLGFGQGNYNDALMEQLADHGQRQLRLHRQRAGGRARCSSSR